jgi:hypothetical protein
LIPFALRSNDQRRAEPADFMPVPDLFTGKLCPKTRLLAEAVQPARERLRINNC